MDSYKIAILNFIKSIGGAVITACDSNIEYNFKHYFNDEVVRILNLNNMDYSLIFIYNNILWFLEIDDIRHFQDSESDIISTKFDLLDFDDAAQFEHLTLRDWDILKSNFAVDKGAIIRIMYSDMDKLEYHINNAIKLKWDAYYSSPQEYKWIDRNLPINTLSNLIIKSTL